MGTKHHTSGRSLSPTHVLQADRLGFFALGGVKWAGARAEDDRPLVAHRMTTKDKRILLTIMD
jgi:hypothetical protein